MYLFPKVAKEQYYLMEKPMLLSKKPDFWRGLLT